MKIEKNIPLKKKGGWGVKTNLINSMEINDSFVVETEDETRVYDLSELEDPSLLNALLEDKEIINLRTAAGVNLSSSEVLTSVGKYKTW